MSARKGTYAVLLFLTSVLLYLPSLQYAFSPVDEKWLIFDNIPLFDSENAFFKLFAASIHEVFYRPLLLVSLFVDYSLGGANPLVYHLDNIILHGLSVVLLYRLFRVMDTAAHHAFLWSLVFAVHPLALHAVAWIPGRNDSLLFIFLSLSLICLLNKKAGSLPLHALFFLCAILTKESALLFPLIYLAFLRTGTWPRRRYLSASILWLAVIAGWLLFRQQSVTGIALSLPPSLTPVWETALAMLAYTAKLLIPFGQSVTPTLRNTSFPAVLAGLIVLIVILLLKQQPGKKRVVVAALSLFIFPLLVPVFFSMQQQPAILYEHRAYSSFAGLLLLISLYPDKEKSRLITALAFLAVMVYGSITLLRMPVYRDAESYMVEAVKDCPENYVHHFEMGNIFFERGNLYGALESFNKALAIHPGRAQILNNRGNVYYQLKHYRAAIADYSAAYQASGNDMILLSRSASYLELGDIGNCMKDFAVIKRCCAGSIPPGLETKITTAYHIYRNKELNRLISENPGSGILYVNRAKYRLEQRKGREALADLRKACELEPGNADFRRYLNELQSTLPE